MALLAYDDVMLREPRLLVPHQIPLGPVRIDRRHPAGKVCRTCAWHDGTELVSRQPLTTTVVVSDWVKAYNQFGPYRSSGAATQANVYATWPVNGEAYNNTTVLYVGAPNSTSTALRYFFSCYNGSASVAALGTYTLNSKLHYWLGDTGEEATDTANSVAARTNWCAWGMSRIGGAYNFRVYDAAARQVIVADDSDTTTATDAIAGNWQVGREGTTTRYAAFSCIATFSPALPLGLLVDMLADPYQFLIPA